MDGQKHVHRFGPFVLQDIGPLRPLPKKERESERNHELDLGKTRIKNPFKLTLSLSGAEEDLEGSQAEIEKSLCSLGAKLRNDCEKK